jgi:eukaryotic-like serine/threonine-protein kinase
VELTVHPASSRLTHSPPAPTLGHLEARLEEVRRISGRPASPEVDQANFAPRVRVPTLMINGRHDFFNPYETSQRPLFELLGTPARDKELRVLEAGHVPDPRDIIRESNAWFDRYLGPIRPIR